MALMGIWGTEEACDDVVEGEENGEESEERCWGEACVDYYGFFEGWP